MSLNRLTSIWESTLPPREPEPPLVSIHEADFVVIGAGITGLTCALRLSEAGARIIILEAHELGRGTTGRSTGNLYATIDEGLSTLQKKYDRAITESVVNARRSAIDLIEAQIQRNSIECGFRRVHLYQFQESDSLRTRRFLEQESRACSDSGLSVYEIPSAPVHFHTLRTLVLADQAQFNPLQYARGLSQVLLQRGVRIFENTPALEVQKGRVRTPEGSAHAPKIIIATHSPIGIHRVQFQLSPVRESGVAWQTPQPPQPGIFWRMDSPERSFRSHEASGSSWIMAVGEDYKTGHRSRTKRSLKKLDSYLSSRFQLTGEPIHWSAQSYRSADDLPYFGETRDGIQLLTGFSTQGLTYGTLGAMIVTDQLLGHENPWSDLFKLNRLRPLKSAGILSKEGFDNARQYLKRVTPTRGPRAMETLPPGQGCVVHADGERVAVYRDEENQLHAVSAICTHMKCQVRFNEAERTWDCPCHASRFSISGEVIEGPALRNLERKDPHHLFDRRYPKRPEPPYATEERPEL